MARCHQVDRQAFRERIAARCRAQQTLEREVAERTIEERLKQPSYLEVISCERPATDLIGRDGLRRYIVTLLSSVPLNEEALRARLRGRKRLLDVEE